MELVSSVGSYFLRCDINSVAKMNHLILKHSWNWQKKGLLISPPSNKEDGSHATMPFALRKSDENEVEIYYSMRDPKSRSKIYSRAGLIENDRIQIDPVSKLILEPGELGSFDDSGVIPSWIVRTDKNELFLYYIGVQLGVTVPFSFQIGLAISLDGGKTFERHSRAPILGRTPASPILSTAPCVLLENGLWRMWYVSGVKWENRDDGLRHYYLIKYAESENGLDWKQHEDAAIDFEGPDEYALARPCVIRDNDGYWMWFAKRGEKYRMALAFSSDGIAWERIDQQVGIEVGPDDWDSQSIEYAHVFKLRDRWAMLYNGNNYGQTGVGYAFSNFPK